MYCSADQLVIPRGLTSVIGSGGKTTFLKAAASVLCGTVILTTSTHMYPFPEIPFVDTSDSQADPAARIREMLRQNSVVTVGHRLPNGKLSSPSDRLSFEALSRLADYVLVEADGSKQLPLKAHRPFEPVIPGCSSLTLCLVGASGLGRPLSQVCHCPDRFAALSGMETDQPVTPDGAARVLNAEDLADYYLINQTDCLPDPNVALELCSRIRKPAFAGSLIRRQFL